MRRAGKLHEIGHLALSQRVFDIPTPRRRPEQTELVNRYPKAGAELLEQFHAAAIVAELVRDQANALSP